VLEIRVGFIYNLKKKVYRGVVQNITPKKGGVEGCSIPQSRKKNERKGIGDLFFTSTRKKTEGCTMGKER